MFCLEKTFLPNFQYLTSLTVCTFPSKSVLLSSLRGLNPEIGLQAQSWITLHTALKQYFWGERKLPEFSSHCGHGSISMLGYNPI